MLHLSKEEGVGSTIVEELLGINIRRELIE